MLVSGINKKGVVVFYSAKKDGKVFRKIRDKNRSLYG